MHSNGATTHYYYATTLFSNSIKTRNLKLGRALHSHLIKTAFILDTFFTNRLIELYSKSNSIHCAQKTFDDLTLKNAHSWNTLISAHCRVGRFDKARHLLDEMPEPNLVSYNSIISSFCRGGFYKEAINVFKGMQKWSHNAVLMDEFTVVGLANTCASLGTLELLRQVHGVALSTGLDFNVVVCNALIDAYGKCGVPQSSYSTFIRMEEKDVVSWTSMVVAYASASQLDDACSIFSKMPVRNVVSWTALITGLAQNGEGERALYFFTRMHDEGVIANDITYVSVLSACADLALIGRGKQIHCHIIRRRNSSMFDNVLVINSLIDMYSKCGDMISPMRLFDRLHKKDTITWNSIITGFAQNGHGEASLGMFEKMVQENDVRPNDVTFIGVLSACSHSGLVSEGLRVVDIMEKKFGLIPRSHHFAILVDLLGRKNRLREALEVIEKAPYGCDRIGMWGALLGTCRVHRDSEIATRAAEALFELEPENTGRYVMLHNIYVTGGRWDDARRIRRVMEELDLKKEAGCSWIEVKNERYVFVAQDIVGCEADDIQELIVSLVNQMKACDYNGQDSDSDSDSDADNSPCQVDHSKMLHELIPLSEKALKKYNEKLSDNEDSDGSEELHLNTSGRAMHHSSAISKSESPEIILISNLCLAISIVCGGLTSILHQTRDGGVL
ncbi:hypothetical protein BUALT_Bualt03G0116200 [Buddleja alternifolia]|uniref:Uncharacterized protein n=1 Tax=Buddleja alternifolia TaxID=168488 RepID=A0AAV6Y119_9LAMI|nr:hypothetical protein BUALT_Bualt03G0116200 [Buddleja alternifolia]